MADTVNRSSVERHLLSSEMKTKMAKAALVDVRKAEMDEQWRSRVGQAVDSVRTEQKLSLKEFADALKRDERQVSRWIDGKEHAQIAAVFAVAEFRRPLVLALCALAGEGVEIETVVRIRKRG